MHHPLRPLSLDKKFSIPSGVLAGQSVLNLLNEMTLGYHDDDLDFDSLPIPLRMRGLRHGERRGAGLPPRQPAAGHPGRACPFQGAFAPVIRDSMVLVDGGIYNNFPVDVARDMGADIIIGVDLAAGPHDMEGLTSMMGLIDQITTFLGRDEYTKNLQDVDLYLKPDIKPFNSGSFNPEAVDSLLIRGERCARQNWDKIVALQDSIYTGNTYMIRKGRILASDTDSVRIGNIEFVGLTRNEETFLRPSFGIDEQTVITEGASQRRHHETQRVGALLLCHLYARKQTPYTLTVSVDEKQEAMINVGFRFDTEEMASILLNTTPPCADCGGHGLGLTVRLNENPYIKLDFRSSNILMGRLSLSYMYKSNNYRLYRNGRGINNITLRPKPRRTLLLTRQPHRLQSQGRSQLRTFQLQLVPFRLGRRPHRRETRRGSSIIT